MTVEELVDMGWKVDSMPFSFDSGRTIFVMMSDPDGNVALAVCEYSISQFSPEDYEKVTLH